MSKEFPASETKLTLLRQNGVFPRSNYLQRAIRSVVFVCVIFFVAPSFFSVEEFRGFFDLTNVNQSEHAYNILAKLCFISVAFLSLSFFLGLFQTKFFFAPNLARVDFSRIKFLSLISFNSFFCHLVVVFALITTLFFSFYKHLGLYLIPIEGTISQGFIKFKSMLVSNSMLYLAYLIAFGLSSYLLNWFLFRREHMMSRAELEAEYRDQQAAKYR